MRSCNQHSTAVVFLCSDCGAVYKTVQQYAESAQLGHFDCSNCNRLVHSWHGVYSYSSWAPVLVKKASRSVGQIKRQDRNGARHAPLRWTEQEDHQLLEMAMTDMTAFEMARSLMRTPGSIYSRLQRLYRGHRKLTS